MRCWCIQMNMPSEEYLHMPLGEVEDLITAYQIINGMAEDDYDEESFIPDIN